MNVAESFNILVQTFLRQNKIDCYFPEWMDEQNQKALFGLLKYHKIFRKKRKGPTPYRIYMNEHRTDIEEKFPEATPKEISNIIREEWKRLPNIKKRDYDK